MMANKYLLIAGLFIAAPGLSCKTHDTPTSPEGPMAGWSFVATVDGLDDITHHHLRSLLGYHGIDSSIEGSVQFGVSVPAKDHARAIDIITNDLRSRHYRITLHTGRQDQQYTVPDDRWKEEHPRMPLHDLLATEPYRSTPALSTLLRSPDVAAAAMTFPQVARITLLERPYLDSQYKPRIGYDIEMELNVSLVEPIGSCCLCYLVWDDGRQIEKISSWDWWEGDTETAENNREKYDRRPPDKRPRFHE
jgi:hypothetical protein